MIDDLKRISIDSKLGQFAAASLRPSNILPLVPLRVDRGRQFYGSGKFDGRNATSPNCRSDNGIVPAVACGTKSMFGSWVGGLSPTCAACPQNQKTTPANYRCKPLWSMVVLCDDQTVRRLVINQPSQGAMEQWVYRLEAEIKRLNETEGIMLRLCDFAFTLRLERRPTMRTYSLAYPVGMNADLFQCIPFDGNGSKYADLWERYNRATVSEQPTSDDAKLTPVTVDEQIETPVPVLDTGLTGF